MKKPEFLERVRQRMFELRVNHERAAEYLHMTQPTFSRKLAGKYPFLYEEAEKLKELLGMSADPPPAHPVLETHRSGMLKKVLEALPEADQRAICHGISWGLEAKEERLKPEGQEALRALRALSG